MDVAVNPAQDCVGKTDVLRHQTRESLHGLEGAVDCGVGRDTAEVDELISRKSQPPSNDHVMTPHGELNVVIEHRIERVAMPHRTEGDFLDEVTVFGRHGVRADLFIEDVIDEPILVIGFGEHFQREIPRARAPIQRVH